MLLLLTALLACNPIGDTENPEGDTDTDADADTDTDADTDADTDTVPGDTGPYLDPGEPNLIAGFDNSTFETEDGIWLVVGAETWLSGDLRNQEVSLTVVVTGDLAGRGSYPVSIVRYYDSIDEDSWDFQYTGTGEASFVVDGHDDQGELLWGHLTGSIPLTDLQGGPATTLESLVLESWPNR